MEPQEAFGLVLKKYRNLSGLSQEELAHNCNLDRTFISLLERGKRNPTLNTIFTLCRQLNISISDFIREVEKLHIESKK